jgi:hypothetical protein
VSKLRLLFGVHHFSSVLDESACESLLDGCAHFNAESGALKVGSDSADSVSEGSLDLCVTSFREVHPVC